MDCNRVPLSRASDQLSPHQIGTQDLQFDMSSPYSQSNSKEDTSEIQMRRQTYTAGIQHNNTTYTAGIQSKQDPRSIPNGVEMAPLGGDKLVQSTVQKKVGSTKVGATFSNYVVEHLASFPQDARKGQITPADAVRKLKTITNEGGLWTQLMNMKVSTDSVTMANGETMEIIEEYMLEQISVCTNVLNDPVMQNLLIFATKFSKDKVGAMHMFQCAENEAQLISDDINRQRDLKTKVVSGAVVNGGFSTEGEPEVIGQRTKSIHKQHSGVHQRVEQFQMVSEQQPPPINSGGISPIDDGNYMETVKNNRDVEILNHCIDEIENFVLELKSINEARKRLSKKKRSRKKKDKEILENSAKSPSEDKLTDIFQKFKHCFNLLAKLKHHISNPNSPELVHYLMIPLTIISKVTSVDMVRSIQSPLLTAGAIEMLGNCLDSHENEYWKSLGSNWTLPKTAPCFKEKYLTTYIPVFTDGWVAPEIITDERGEAAAKSTAVMVAKMKIVEEDEVKQGREVSTHNEPTEVARIPAAPGGKIALVVYDYWAHNNKELTIRAGQKVHVLDDSRRWWLVRNDHSEQGYVPSTVLEFPREDSSDSSSMDGSISPGSSASNTAKLGSIKSPYSPAFPPEVIDKLQNEASKESKTVVTETPTREVVKVTRETVVVENTFVFNEEESQQTAVESVPVESFPPPPEFPEVQVSVSSSTPPIPPPFVATEIHQVVLKTTPPPVKAKPAKTEELESPQQDFQAELAARLQTTPTTTTIQDDVDFFIPLFKSSTADDVSRWLRKLGFNESVLEKLQGTEAKKLFQMSRKDLIERLGDEESAIVLHDELQVQIGAQSRHKTMTEFQRALVKRINRQGTQKIAPSSSLAPPRAADVPSSQVTQVTNTEIKTTIVTNTNSKMTQEEMQKLFEEQQQLIKSQQEQLSHLKEQGDTANNNVEALTAL